MASKPQRVLVLWTASVPVETPGKATISPNSPGKFGAKMGRVIVGVDPESKDCAVVCRPRKKKLPSTPQAPQSSNQ